MKREKKTGRNLKTIDWNKVDTLLESHSTGTEVAAYFGIHPNTFYIRCEKEKKVGFSEYQQQKAEKGNIRLRDAQEKLALKGNATMLVWLGKQYLNQKDKEDTTAQVVKTLSDLVKLIKEGSITKELTQQD